MERGSKFVKIRRQIGMKMSLPTRGEGDVKNKEKNADVIYGWLLAFFLIKDHALSSFLSFYVTNSETGETIYNEFK